MLKVGFGPATPSLPRRWLASSAMDRKPGGEMNKFKRGAWLILAALLLSAPVAWGQTAGRIMGSPKDAQGAVLPGATVPLTGPALQGAQTQVTDQDGSFRFMSVPPGRYTVKIELASFKTM